MELSAAEAAKVVGVATRTIYNYVDRGILPARRETLKRRIRIDAEDLRRFAEEHGLRFDDAKIKN